MGIKFPCHVCNKRLNVKAFLAGKRGICPHCGTKVDIPWQSVSSRNGQLADEDDDAGASSIMPRTVSPRVKANGAGHAAAGARVPVAGSAVSEPAHVPMAVPTARRPGTHGEVPSPERKEDARHRNDAPAAPPSTPQPPTVDAPVDPLEEAPNAVWYVRPPTGGEFGPAAADVMRRWLGEGRVSADSLVWREGWPDWKTAGPLFAELGGGGAPRPPAAGSVAATAVATTFGVPPLGESSAAASSRPYKGRRNNNTLAIVMVVVLTVASLGLLGVLLAVTMR